MSKSRGQRKASKAVLKERELESKRRRASDVAALSFSGGRYETAGFPLDGIHELEKYQRLVIEAAKMIWGEKHPNAKQLPRDFANLVRLRLTSVEKGSVVPVLERESMISIPGAPDLLELSIDYVDRTFESIVNNLALLDDAPEYFGTVAKLFGVSFKAKEKATFRNGKSGAVVYTAEKRKAFIEATRTDERPISGTLIGTIRMLDSAQEFILVNTDGLPIKGNFSSDSTFESLHGVHKVRDQADLVWIVCTYFLDAETGMVTKIEDVDDAGLFAPSANAWAIPLAELASRPAGWLDGEGKAIEVTAIVAAREVLDEVTTDANSDPSLFGDVEGGVRLEWLTTDAHTVVSIDPDARFSGYHFNLATGEEDSFDGGGPDAALAFLRGRVDE